MENQVYSQDFRQRCQPKFVLAFLYRGLDSHSQGQELYSYVAHGSIIDKSEAEC
jgi:hypothetical protein